MNKEEITSYRDVYVGFSKRVEKHIANRFWWIVAFFSALCIPSSFIELPWIVKVISIPFVGNTVLLLWFLRKNFFESMREMKLVFLIYAVVNIVLAFGLIASAFLLITN